MSTRIQIKRGTTTPAGLTTGEFAYNVTNSTLYIGNTADQKWIGGEVTGGVDMGAGSAASQNRVPTQNAVYQYAQNNFVHRLNGITGGITLNAGTNITITSSVGGGITIASSDTVGVTAGDAVTWTQLQRFPAGISAHGATLSGTVTAPTQAIGTNNTTVATTAFVQSEIVADTVTSFNGRTGSVQGVSAAVAGDGISVSGATGSVTITNSGVTRAVAGTGIGLNANTGTVTITNNGVQSFNGLTGTVGGVCAAQANTFTALQTFTAGISAAGGVTLASPSLTGTPLATTAVIGTNTTQIATTAFVQNEIVADTVTSFNGRTGSVQGVSAAVAGDGISVSGATGSVTITNSGVTRAVAGTGISVSANTGTVTITNTGALLTANTFTGLQTFTAGISAAGGITLTSPYFTGAPESLSLRTGKLVHPSGQTYITIQPSTVPGSGSLRFQNDTVDPATYYATLTATSTTADSTIVLPAESGTLALTKNVVTSFNGRTGAVQGVSAAVAGDGISVSGATGSVTITNSGVTRAVAGTGIGLNANTGTVTITNNGVQTLSISSGNGIQADTISGTTGAITYTITNTGVTRAVAGTGIGLNANTGTVTITNNGVQSFNGSTGAVQGVSSIVAGTNITITPTGGTGAVTVNAAGVTTTSTNTFTAVQIFTAGLSASGGVTLASPNLVGTPTATTAAVGTNTTQIATTAFVQNEIIADTVTSIDGVTGAITNVARTNLGNTFSVVQVFNAGISAAGGITFNGIVNGATATFSRLVTGNAGFSGALTGAVTGNASTATALQTARGFSLSGDVTASVVNFDGTSSVTLSTAIASGVIVNDDINASAGIVDTKLATISTVGKVSNSATTATNANTASAIVARDASGNFSAGTITASLTGTASNASSLGNTAAASWALLASPTFTGIPAAPTPAIGTNTTQIATTAFVQSEIIADTVTSIDGVTGAITNVARKNTDNAFSALQTFTTGISAAGGITFNGNFNGATATFSRLVTGNAGFSGALTGTATNASALGGVAAASYAQLASPAFTGTPTSTTAAIGTNTTQIATTAFVQNEIVADTVTSFNGRTGAVQGVSAAVAGDGISVSGATGSVTITNSGVTRAVAGTGIGLNANTGTVTITNNGVQTLTISSGNGIQADTISGTTGAITYTITNTGVTRAVAGTGISVSANTGTVTITNNGVQSFNGLTGAVGGVCAAQANTFTALQTFTTGISADGALTLNGTITGATATFSRLVTGNAGFSGALTGTATNASSLGGTAAASWALLASPTFTGVPAAPTPAVGTNTTQIATTAFVNSEIIADAVTSFNGRTGSIQGVSAAVAGDGISVSGATGSVTITNSGVTRAVAGTGISVSANTGTVTITNEGVRFLNGITGGITLNQGTNITITSSVAGGITIAASGGGGGALTADANIWTATQYFNAGFSAASGVTFTGTVSGATATFSQILSANGGISASGITLPSGSKIMFGVGDGFVDATTFLRLGQNSGRIYIGDVSKIGNATYIFMRDAASTIDVVNPYGIIRLGDPDGINSGTYINIDSSATAIDIVGTITQTVGNFESAGSVTGKSGVQIGADAISAKTSGYTLAAADNGKVLTFNSSSTTVVGVDTVAGATGFSCTVIQLGTGGVRFASSGVTLNSYAGLTLAGQHAAASLVCYQTNVFNVSGNLTP